jgi:hypothetical protein
MDWLQFIPALISGAGAIFGSNEDRTSTSTTMTPELQAFVKEAIQRGSSIYNKPYPEYQGQRVAGPTAARTTLDQMLPQMQRGVQGAMAQNSGLIDQVINRAPVRVQIPNLVSGGPSATISGGTFGEGWPTVPRVGG